jgi:hypothetical protein
MFEFDNYIATKHIEWEIDTEHVLVSSKVHTKNKNIKKLKEELREIEIFNKHMKN